MNFLSISVCMTPKNIVDFCAFYKTATVTVVKSFIV